MKYCPFCGAELIDGAVSFCAECGKELPYTQTETKQSEFVKEQSSKKEKNLTPSTPASKVADEGYDGYYNDVLPSDENHRSEGFDKNLIKRISVLLAVLFVIIIACVVLMYVF